MICISIRCFCYAQDAAKNANQSVAKNTIFGEFGSNSLLYSINYDRILINKEKWKFAGRLGFGYYFGGTHKHSIFDFPSEFTFLIGKSKHFFETGLGVTYNLETYPESEYYYNIEPLHYIYLFSRFGYRYQRPQGGFFFKGGLNVFGPMSKNSRYAFAYSEFIWVLAGVAVGYTFKQRKNK